MKQPPPRSISGKISYLSSSSKAPINFPSVAGGQSERNTGEFDARFVTIRDARQTDASFSLDLQGFELRRHASLVQDWSDGATIDSIYADEVRELVQSATRAARVVVFDFTSRSDSEEIRKAKRLRDPSIKVHNDYTARSAAQRVRDILGTEADTLLARRFGIVNVWRSTHGLAETTPIAICDARSVRESSLIAVERRTQERVGEIYQVTYDPAHAWYYYPSMHPGEVLLIKTFDSEPGVARWAPHCAFENPAAPPDAEPRQSIEARAFAFY